MIGTLVVGAEYVLLNPDPESIAASHPITEGCELVMAICKGLPVGRFVVMMHTTDNDMGEFWCKANGLKPASIEGPIPEDIHEPFDVAEWNTIERIRSQGPVWLVITASTVIYQKCSATHQPVLLFGRRGGLEELPPRESWWQVQERIQRHREAAVEIEPG